MRDSFPEFDQTCHRQGFFGGELVVFYCRPSFPLLGCWAWEWRNCQSPLRFVFEREAIRALFSDIKVMVKRGVNATNELSNHTKPLASKFLVGFVELPNRCRRRIPA